MDKQTSDSSQAETRRCPYCYELIHPDAVKCRYCRSTVDPTHEDTPSKDAPSGRMLLGVCTALAARYMIPVTFIRLAFVLLTLFHGFGILLYVILWAIMPGMSTAEEPKASSWIRSVRSFFRAVKKAFMEEVAGSREDRRTGDEVDTIRDMNASEPR